MTKKLRAAVIGLGRMGAQPSSRLDGKIPAGWLPLTHAEAFRKTDSIELVALCDKDEQRVAEFSEYYNIKSAYTDYQKLIDEVKPDIISVATRTDVRCEIIEYAAKKGVKGFYAEKPLSRSINECQSILNTIRSCGGKIVYGATRRAMDIYKHAKALCWSGELGEIKQIQIDFGKSSLLWTHTHSVDLITFFANSTDFSHVQGWCDIEEGAIKDFSFIDHDPIVEHAYFKFANGITATITQSPGLNVRIACSKGLVTVHGDGYSIEVNRVNNLEGYFHGIEEILIEPQKSGTQYLIEDLHDAVRYNNKIKHIQPEEIISSHEMLIGIVQSTLLGGRLIKRSEIQTELQISGRTGIFFA